MCVLTHEQEMRKYDANPDSAANSMLAQAFDRMERVVAEVNECMLESDTQAQVLQVQELFSTESQDLELAKPFRRMICKDLFPHVLYRAKEKKNRVIESHFFLMSDVLVVGVERNRRYLLSAVLPLERCTVDLVDCKNDSMRLGMEQRTECTPREQGTDWHCCPCVGGGGRSRCRTRAAHQEERH